MEQARDSQAAGRHEWACFASHQAAEKAFKGFHLHFGQEAWGQVVASHDGMLRIGYIGSYARGDWGVGSDLDLVVVVTSSSLPFTNRSSEWDVTALPVPVDLWIYTEQEWQALLQSRSRFSRVILQEAVWVYPGASPAKRS